MTLADRKRLIEDFRPAQVGWSLTGIPGPCAVRIGPFQVIPGARWSGTIVGDRFGQMEKVEGGRRRRKMRRDDDPA